MSAICSGRLQVFFTTHGPKLYVFALQKWGAEINISEITWRPCCSLPDFYCLKLKLRIYSTCHGIRQKSSFVCWQTLIDILRLNWDPE